ncbi:HET-C-related protein [Pseudomonas sp. NPDC087615]|uniref:HET-C-related protein n=1 Tax=Pseudomonas sp. NPDC087615 TaxID=3364443 RepID=UPI0038079B41
MLSRAVMTVGAIALFMQLAYAEDTPKKPPPPPDIVPTLHQSNPPVLCVGCDGIFDMRTHKEVLENLSANPYLAELRKALYQQDIVHQFESKAHFDNCDFDSAITYVTSLLDEADEEVGTAMKAKSVGDLKTMEIAAGSAFFAIGQALHAVQDFYAHTNYVEMQAPKANKVTDIEVVAPWRPKGRDRINELREEGLYSGYVFWGFPQKCPANTTSHGDLAKDTATTKSGAKKLPHLQDLNQYNVAVFLASQASLELMKDAFKRWPLLKDLNGRRVAFETLVDRRGIDGKN